MASATIKCNRDDARGMRVHAPAHLVRFRETFFARREGKKHSPGVELVDDAFEADDSEESGAETG